MTEQANKIPEAASILGTSYNVHGDGTIHHTPLVWDHQDDLFVEFFVPRFVISGDPEFFERYTTRKLNEDEKHFTTEYHVCFIEADEIIEAAMRDPLKEYDDAMKCVLVMFRGCFGLLTFGSEESDEITRRAFGVAEEINTSHYKATFMRFSDEAIAKFDLAGTVASIYEERAFSHEIPLRVNFAKYNENSES